MKRAYPHLRDADAASTPFFVVDKAPSFIEDDHIDRMIAEVKAIKSASDAEHAIVVVDTLNRALDGADENSSSTAAKVISNGERIAKETSSYVLFIHPTTKAGGVSRGSSAFRGNAHDEFYLRAEKRNNQKIVMLAPVKQKDDELQERIPFEISSFQIGTNNLNKVVTVPCAMPMKPQGCPALDKPAPTRGANQDLKPGEKRASDVERVLKDLSDAHAGRFFTAIEIRAHVGEPFDDVRHNLDSLRKAVDRALGKLIENGQAQGDGGTGYRYVAVAGDTGLMAV